MNRKRMCVSLTAIFRASGLPAPSTEYRFAEKRRWRFDYAWPEPKIALEYEGGVPNRGWHQSPMRYHGDCVKYNAAALCGWLVLRVTALHKTREIIELVDEAFRTRKREEEDALKKSSKILTED